MKNIWMLYYARRQPLARAAHLLLMMTVLLLLLFGAAAQTWAQDVIAQEEPTPSSVDEITKIQS